MNHRKIFAINNSPIVEMKNNTILIVYVCLILSDKGNFIISLILIVYACLILNKANFIISLIYVRIGIPIIIKTNIINHAYKYLSQILYI